MFELMFDPKEVIDETLRGSNSEKQVAKNNIVQKGTNRAEKKEIEAELLRRKAEGALMSCILTTRDRRTKELVTQEFFWIPGITTKLSKFNGRLCQPRSNVCSSI